MSGGMSPVSIVPHPAERAAVLLTGRLEQNLVHLRPHHPISILDLSPDEGTSVELARWARHIQRKVRMMTYEWKGAKNRERYVGLPEVLVEKGMFPGLHFSSASFDFVVGVDVLRTITADQRRQTLREMGRVAMRQVCLIENNSEMAGPPLLESELRDSLIGSGLPKLDLQLVGGMLQVVLPRD